MNDDDGITVTVRAWPGEVRTGWLAVIPLPERLPLWSAFAVLDACGMSRRAGTIATEPCWTGSHLIVDSDLTADQALHELGHWLVSPEHRHLPDFGLGRGQRGIYTPATREPGPFEEEAASLLGICYVAALGGSWWTMAEEHGWVVPGLLDFGAFLAEVVRDPIDPEGRDALAHMMQAGLIDEEARPTRGL